MNYEMRLKTFERVVAMREKKMTFREISKALSISEGGAWVFFKRGKPQPIKRNENPMWKRVLPSHKSGRGRARMLVRFRDNFTCQDCGSIRTPEEARDSGKRLFDVHHLNGLCGKKSKGYDSPKNIDGLITLCHKCHFNRPEHRVKSPAFRKGL